MNSNKQQTSFILKIAQLLHQNEGEILIQWLALQREDAVQRNHLLSDAVLREQSQTFLTLLRNALQVGNSIDTSTGAWAEVRELLHELSRSRAKQGFTPSETAIFLFSLKQPLFDQVRQTYSQDPEALAEQIWTITLLIDQLGLYTVEASIQGREETIARQHQELLELSTPVVRLADGILALPLIGTLDSERTQIVMENLLQKIVETGSGLAIIDITGVPIVDTLVAQHLLKTVAAARLMGADCIISGIRPQIAQTIVHLGVDLSNVLTKATLADAFALALQRTGQAIVRVSARPAEVR